MNAFLRLMSKIQRLLSTYHHNSNYSSYRLGCCSSSPTSSNFSSIVLRSISWLRSSRRSMALHNTDDACNSSIQTFEGSTDRFGGVTIVSNQEKCTEENFENTLIASLNAWKKTGVRGVWFHIHLNHATWVPVLAKHEFEFHHAEGSTAVMVRWLPTDQPHSIPKYAHTVVGVGAMVVREDTNELLVVRERFNKNPHWKLPGGYVERGEDLSTAAAREVLEETGIECEFSSVVATRHTHAAAFLCSDFYFILLMKPVASTEIKMCTHELVACQWMKLEEYRDHPLVHETNRFFVDCYLESRSRGVCISATPLYSKVMKKQQLIYSLNFGEKVSSNSSNSEEDENSSDCVILTKKQKIENSVANQCSNMSNSEDVDK